MKMGFPSDTLQLNITSFIKEVHEYSKTLIELNEFHSLQIASSKEESDAGDGTKKIMKEGHFGWLVHSQEYPTKCNNEYRSNL